MLDPATVASLSSLRSLESLASRTALDALGAFTGEGRSFSSFRDCPFALIVTSDNSVQALNTVDEATCSSGAHTITSRTAWITESPVTAPTGPVWKWLREFDNVLALCEDALPQQRRLQFVLESDATPEGRERFPRPVETHLRELISAEDWVFRSSVFSAVVWDLWENENALDGVSGRAYVNASEDGKARKIGSMLRQRSAILHAVMVRDRPERESFLRHVLGIWLHMINFNGKLGKKKLSGPPGTIYWESPYHQVADGEDDEDSDQIDEHGFCPTIAKLLPGVLAYFREQTGP